MDVLIRYGFSMEEIKNMMENNSEIENVPDKNIYEIIDILGSIGCLNNHIKNIFCSNPYCISRNPKDIQKLIDKMTDMGLTHLDLVFDSNPYLLNITSKELERVQKNKKKEGFNALEINNYIYYESAETF